MLEQFLKKRSPWERPISEQFMKDCHSREVAHAGAGEQHEKEGATETNCYELTTICHSPVALGAGEEEVEESGKEE